MSVNFGGVVWLLKKMVKFEDQFDSLIKKRFRNIHNPNDIFKSVSQSQGVISELFLK